MEGGGGGVDRTPIPPCLELCPRTCGSTVYKIKKKNQAIILANISILEATHIFAIFCKSKEM